MLHEQWQQEVGVVEDQMQGAWLREDSCILHGEILHALQQDQARPQ